MTETSSAPQLQWDNRQRSLLQVSDRADRLYLPQLHSISKGMVDDGGLTAWINEGRVPVYQALAAGDASARSWLAGRGVDVDLMAASVADVTGTTAYPVERVVANSQAAENEHIGTAQRTITPGLHYDDTEPIDGQYNPLLGTITINTARGEQADAVDIYDTVAACLGQAITGKTVNVDVQQEPSPAFRYWYGAQWRHADAYAGGIIQKGLVAHIAASARERIGAHIDAPDEHPLIAPYLRSDGYYHESGAAMCLDIINQAAGFNSHQAGIYDPLLRFAMSGAEDAEARGAAQSIVTKATRGTMRLEDIETVSVAFEGMPLGLLRRIEEACELEGAQRPSSIFIARA